MAAIGVGFHFGPYHQDNSTQGQIHERLGLLFRSEYHADGILWAPIDFLLWERVEDKKIELGFMFGLGLKMRIEVSSFNLFGEVVISGPGGRFLYIDIPYSYGIELPLSTKLIFATQMRTGVTYQLGLTRFLLFIIYIKN